MDIEYYGRYLQMMKTYNFKYTFKNHDMLFHKAMCCFMDNLSKWIYQNDGVARIKLDAIIEVTEMYLRQYGFVLDKDLYRLPN